MGGGVVFGEDAGAVVGAEEEDGVDGEEREAGGHFNWRRGGRLVGLRGPGRDGRRMLFRGGGFGWVFDR